MKLRPQTGHSLRRPPVPAAVGRAALAWSDWRVRSWDTALERIRDTQTTELLRILSGAQRSEFGLAHGFDRIRSYEQFRDAVPVSNYDSAEPAIHRMMEGESNVLVDGTVTYFANSSGTSNLGRPKYLPITETQIQRQKGSASDALLRYLAHSRDQEALQGFLLGLFPPLTVTPRRTVVVTTNPSLMFSRLPLAARIITLPRGSALTEPDYGKKLEILARQYLDYDVRTLTGTTCWFSLLFDKLLQEARKRGRRVQSVREVWPHLRLLIGGGVSATPYLPVIARCVGDTDFTLVDTYNATEGGIFAVSDHSEHPGLLLIPDRGVFFELLPANQLDAPEAARIPVWEAEPDRTYAVLVTTPSGLYSYTIGDLVRVRSTRPLRLEFAGRVQGCLSLTQELTTSLEIEESMTQALGETGSPAPVDYALGSEVGVTCSSRARYVLFGEFPDVAQIPGGPLTSSFDRALQSRNRVYREHRQADVAILPPRLVFLRRGAVEDFMRSHRRNNVQAKFPRILSDRDQFALASLARNVQ